MNQNLKAYGAQAEILASDYNAVATPDILPDFCNHILSLQERATHRVLDLGCGTGRDAFWLASQGFSVVAVDGTPEMLAEAQTSHSHPLINYVQDTAPELAKLGNMDLKFDIVLMSAFLFHFDAAERFELYHNIKPLLRDKSYMYITLRHGPVPEGRVMHPVALQELEDFAHNHGGISHYHGMRPDPLKRPGVSWDHVSMMLK